MISALSEGGHTSYKDTKTLITKAGFIAGVGLLLIYGGLIFSGALLSAEFSENATRTEILTSLSSQTLGATGTSFYKIAHNKPLKLSCCY